MGYIASLEKRKVKQASSREKLLLAWFCLPPHCLKKEMEERHVT